MTRKSILLTGATGFLGKVVAQSLSDSGFQVHCIAREQSSLPEWLVLASPVKVYRTDGSLSSLREICIAADPHFCVHLASLFIVDHKPEEVHELIESNVAFGSVLMEALRETKCRIFVNTGTSWQHFENERFNPVNLYAATKQAFDSILEYYSVVVGFRVLTLKLFDTFGENDQRRKLIPLLLKAATQGTPLEMSPGDQRLNLCHVDDIARGYVQALERMLLPGLPRSEEFTLRSNTDYSLKEIVAIVREESKLEINISLGARPYRDREVMAPWTGGKVLPGWNPRIEFGTWFRAELGRRA